MIFKKKKQSFKIGDKVLLICFEGEHTGVIYDISPPNKLVGASYWVDCKFGKMEFSDVDLKLIP
jgi:hypothetical protein